LQKADLLPLGLGAYRKLSTALPFGNARLQLSNSDRSYNSLSPTGEVFSIFNTGGKKAA